MKRIISFIAIGLAGATAGAGTAQAASATDVRTYSACILKRATDDARALLATPIGSAAEEQLGSLIVNRYQRCLNDTEMPPPGYSMLRGMLAEALLLSDPAARAAAAALASAEKPSPATGEGRAMIASLGACLVASNPKAAVAVISSGRGSIAEREAMSGFGDAMKTCGKQGSAQKVAVPDARNAIADALYQRITGNRVG
jgi:hypothetical protein